MAEPMYTHSGRYLVARTKRWYFMSNWGGGGGERVSTKEAVRIIIVEVHATTHNNGIGRRVLVQHCRCIINQICRQRPTYVFGTGEEKGRKKPIRKIKKRGCSVWTHTAKKEKMTGSGRCWWRRQPSICVEGKGKGGRPNVHVPKYSFFYVQHNVDCLPCLIDTVRWQ